MSALTRRRMVQEGTLLKPPPKPADRRTCIGHVAGTTVSNGFRPGGILVVTSKCRRCGKIFEESFRPSR